jgi:NAD(P)-dependent dehydrogenase (short-subunit alcohol dehydrogenase family)
MNDKDNRRRVAVVTGAAMGIGQAVAARLARDGHDVAIADLADAAETERLVKEAGAQVHSARVDVTDSVAVGDFIAATTGRLGAPAVVVANAGVYPLMPMLDTSWQVWRKIMDVNVDANYHLLQATLPAMIEAGWGRVVALASTVFHSGPPNTVAYTASKGAVIGLVRALASEVGDHGITVNAVAPTIVRTPGVMDGPMAESGVIEMVRNMQAIKRVVVPEEIASAIAFLASDDAAMITGQTLPVDAGSVRV